MFPPGEGLEYVTVDIEGTQEGEQELEAQAGRKDGQEGGVWM